ncbi:phage tail sheath family protein [Candidatus Viridilinea mediisalina]|uniref:Phage tail protein n=1 Tax=Candidatus Viridilinea mediisalina TaxID=2024553 RepID=A0A2A6RHY4_9CHLR|nr:phage tail sheath subtilisin-like domain-containing protein [Candidatus Viridilinea mediisalina]PDW02495.1 phage tail protein [Candidatus Viridilinea mediisalina]
MPEYLSPGIYIEEVNSGPRPIESVGTACAAFVGFAPAGPVNKPMLVTNWSQYVNTFGSLDESGRKVPHMPGAFLSHAVFGYFLNGGGRCYVTRVAPTNGAAKGEEKSAQLQLPSKSSKAVPSLTFTPKGTPAADITIEVQPPTGEAPPEGSFTLNISMGEVRESYENVNLGKKGRPVVDTVNQGSKLVTVAEVAGPGSLADRAPEVGNYIVKAPTPVAPPKLKANDLMGSVVERSGIEGLEIAEDVTMVCCPDLMSAYQSGMIDRTGVKAVQTAMINHCERMADRMAIIDPLPDLTPQEVKKWREAETNYDSMFATLYYPWISVMGPEGQPMSMPPCGHIAGVWARSDGERGVHKAPANEIVRGALGPASDITKGEQDTLNPIGVNCIRSFTGRGIRVWGARTLSSDPAWRYINVRRLFNMVEKSIENGTQWIVFEPNDPGLWSRVRRDVGAYLSTVWRSGALFGATTGEAFYVKCDAELNPPEIRDQGKLIIEVGMAPVKPAEFVIFRFSQFSGGGA